MEVEDRSGQLGHPLPDGAGRSPGEQPAGRRVALHHVRGDAVRLRNGDPQCAQLGSYTASTEQENRLKAETKTEIQNPETETETEDDKLSSHNTI